MDEVFLRKLLEISRHMAENRALDPLLNYAMQIALDLLDAERGYLVLLNEDGALDFRVKMDQNGNELKHPEEQISYSILNKVVSNNKPLVITDALLDPSLQNSDSVQALQLRSVMCAPLTAKGHTLGAIYIENRSNANMFEEEDVDPLMFFAGQAGVAIENAILNDRLEARVAARTAELERAMQQVERSWMEAVEANRLRTMILGNVAHDMRSPIALSISALSAMLDGTFGQLSDKQYEWIERAVKSLRHAVNLTTDIFDLTKAEMGELVIHKEETDLKAYLQELYAVGQGIPWPQTVQFQLNIPDGLPILNLDQTRIKQVLLNLLSNAHKFTESGTVTLHARVQAEKNAVVIGVADTGHGIPAEQLERVFERFQQADQNPQVRKAGTGLGLAISRELVERHNGAIWVESELGRGSDFKFSLPING
jgi:signal transduction histidine kinase